MAASHFEIGTHHCAIYPGDEQGANRREFKECQLNPGHQKFMTVDEFVEKTPSDIVLYGRNRIDRTTRVVANHISADRPDTYCNSTTPYPCSEYRRNHNFIRYGTSFLVKLYRSEVTGPCPCPECKKTSSGQTPNRKSYYFVMKTATHVVFDEKEAQNARFEFFYDSENRSQVKFIYGVTVLDSVVMRLQADRCFVVCVTHDGDLAQKLELLCHQHVPYLIENILVSHPHGVSKRISVGHRTEPTLRLISNKTSVTLKKGTKIRFSGCCDAVCVVEEINRLMDKPVIQFDDLSNTFVLLCDLTASRPEGLVVEVGFENRSKAFVIKCGLVVYRTGDVVADNDDHWIRTLFGQSNKVWCNILTHGIRLVSDEGHFLKFPDITKETPGIKMEVFGNINLFFDYNDIDKISMFTFHRYNMASCPGSSGAIVRSYGDTVGNNISAKTAHVHFGISGDSNASSLNCMYSPVVEEEAKTNPWIAREYEQSKQHLYDWIGVDDIQRN